MTDGEPETVVSASLQKIKLIKNPIKHLKQFFYCIKAETSDSFVSHFDGHFAYLKTLDFYFKFPSQAPDKTHDQGKAGVGGSSLPHKRLTTPKLTIGGRQGVLLRHLLVLQGILVKFPNGLAKFHL